MTDLFSINKSSIGFSYQRRYALCQSLKLILNGNLEKLHIDEPFSTFLSVDVKFQLINPNEIRIYEIKTGDSFKDQPKTELRKIFKNLYIYDKEKTCHSKKFLVVSPKAKSAISEYWGNLQFIKSKGKKNTLNQTRNEVIEIIFADLIQDEYLDKKQFVSLLEEINFEEGPSYKEDGENDDLSDLEDNIVSEIDNFAKALNLRSTTIEIPSWSIALELLEILNKSSERNSDVCSDLVDKLEDCLRRRYLIQQAKYKKDKEKILQNDCTELENAFRGIVKIKKVATLTV